jgi:hypothetical protein
MEGSSWRQRANVLNVCETDLQNSARNGFGRFSGVLDGRFFGELRARLGAVRGNLAARREPICSIQESCKFRFLKIHFATQSLPLHHTLRCQLQKLIHR